MKLQDFAKSTQTFSLHLGKHQNDPEPGEAEFTIRSEGDLCFIERSGERLVSLRDLAQAQAYLDMLGILRDLEFSENAVRRLFSELQTDSPDQVVARSLWNAAVVAYARCFGSGSRNGLQHADVPAEFEEIHKICINGYRNQHIAHPVNQLQADTLGLRLQDQSDIKPSSVLGVIAIVTDPDPIPMRAAQLITLVSRMKSEADTQATARRNAVLAYAGSLDGSELAKLPCLTHPWGSEKHRMQSGRKTHTRRTNTKGK